MKKTHVLLKALADQERLRIMAAHLRQVEEPCAC